MKIKLLAAAAIAALSLCAGTAAQAETSSAPAITEAKVSFYFGFYGNPYYNYNPYYQPYYGYGYPYYGPKCYWSYGYKYCY